MTLPSWLWLLARGTGSSWSAPFTPLADDMCVARSVGRVGMSHESETGWLPKDAVRVASVAEWPGRVYAFQYPRYPRDPSADTDGVPATATVTFTPRDEVGHDVRQGGGVGCSLGLYLAVRGTLQYRVEYADGHRMEHTFEWAELRAYSDRSLTFVVDPSVPVVDSLYVFLAGPSHRLDPPRPFGIVWCSGDTCAQWVPDPTRSDP